MDKSICSNHRAATSSGYLLSHFHWSRISETTFPPGSYWFLCLPGCSHPPSLCQEAVGTSGRRALAWDCLQDVVQASPLCFGEESNVAARIWAVMLNWTAGPETMSCPDLFSCVNETRKSKDRIHLLYVQLFVCSLPPVDGVFQKQFSQPF